MNLELDTVAPFRELIRERVSLTERWEVDTVVDALAYALSEAQEFEDPGTTKASVRLAIVSNLPALPFYPWRRALDELVEPTLELLAARRLEGSP